MSPDDTALRLASTPFRISEFVRKNSGRIALKTIFESVKKLGFSSGMTERQLNKLSVRSDADGIQVTLRYHGPSRGNQPKQRWRVEPDSSGSLSWVQGGSRFFSKGHWVTGVDGRWVVEQGTKQGITNFKLQLKQEIENHLEVNRIG